MNSSVTGIAVVDDSDTLVDCISVKDLKGVGVDGSNFFRLFRSVRHFKDMVDMDASTLFTPTYTNIAAMDRLGQSILGLLLGVTTRASLFPQQPCMSLRNQLFRTS